MSKTLWTPSDNARLIDLMSRADKIIVPYIYFNYYQHYSSIKFTKLQIKSHIYHLSKRYNIKPPSLDQLTFYTASNLNHIFSHLSPASLSKYYKSLKRVYFCEREWFTSYNRVQNWLRNAANVAYDCDPYWLDHFEINQKIYSSKDLSKILFMSDTNIRRFVYLKKLTPLPSLSTHYYFNNDSIKELKSHYPEYESLLNKLSA